ncbi:MAG: 2-C-methyl-D-erythritol 2,4-cyclodiphosphate synthase [Bacteroidales bacterium]|jgi:2-C-methyl-D-erythritol 2,4-cyclodiphosphate synthase|nr:2-C-methyl-D-erythritol 2,4-cyclodiphosphate synthase [Bacteroidales bacterium]MCI2121562.1 2-C-methyl-D-erythritol 2,4-cyclodiphosphate synthase [Bacteroidales bacterium]MCI2145075.1 2-C-methyl-D-erythritol 2,4-cyclodiphosphate synthase [Bacteroidales bacterium]
MEYRIGNGYDVHPLEDGLPFVLGGVRIPFRKGSVAHSDGDALIHALCDALLGALALGDIGRLFPESSDLYKGIDSRILLRESYRMVVQKGYTLCNADITVLLQEPKIFPYEERMRTTLAKDLQCRKDMISIKATTTEKLGYVGRGEGVSAYATVLLKTKE